MTDIGVTRLRRRGGRLMLAGHVRRRAFGRAPRSVALQLCGLTLAETIPSRDETSGPNLWTFRFLLSADLEAVMTRAAPLCVLADGVELSFAPKVQALRAEIPENPALVRDVAEKLRQGFVLTSKGCLQRPFAERGVGLGQILDHYEHCDRVTHEILGHRLHVVGGTLLGAARQGGPIAHDVDFDVAYLSGARDVASVRTEYVAFLQALLRRGEQISLVNTEGAIRRRHFKWRSGVARTAGAAPVVIDVFPAFIDEKGFYCRPTFVRIPGGEALVVPLRRTPFGNREVWAPNRMAEKAESVFGSSWREPDPFWIKPKFPGFHGAISTLTLVDDELLRLAAEMPPAKARQMRAAIAAERNRSLEVPGCARSKVRRRTA